MTDERIELVTYTDSAPLELSDEDVRFIVQKLRGFVGIRRAISADVFTLNPSQFAGLVRLPSWTILRSSPRIPTQNLFRMLAVANDLPDLELEEATHLGELDQMLEFVADFFAGCVEDRIERGLYRAYVETEENLHVVRGRIEVIDDLRRNFIQRHRTYCRYAELTWDVPENQVLRYVCYLLGGWPFSPDLQARLQHIDRRLDEVSRTASEPRRSIGSRIRG